MTTARTIRAICQYCGNPINRGKYCSPDCGHLWRISQRDAERDDKPLEFSEPVLRCCGQRWEVVGVHARNLKNNC